MSRIFISFLVAATVSGTVALNRQMPKPALAVSAAPSPTPTPFPEDPEKIRVTTEEVRIPVFATDDFGNSDASIEADEILVLEDGVPQEVRSVQRLPGS